MLEISDLPGLNAILNATAALLLVGGYLSIRRKRVKLHRRFMLSACTASVLFLTSYLIYHFHQPTTPFPGDGAARVFYLVLLISHVTLAIAVVPLAIITLTRGLRGRIQRHRAIARWTLPIWLYVSVTGVMVYLMIYQW